MKTLRIFFPALFCLLLTVGRAELIVALTPTGALTPGAPSLLTFTSENPGQILSATAITGLVTDEQVVGIDVRPATGELFALTDRARLYTIDPTTGAATLRATLAADPGDASDPFTTLSGAKFAVDFNPVPDRLRVISDTQQSLRINPNNGNVTTDAAPAYVMGDISFGLDPQIVDAAYTDNDDDPATSTTLYVLEQNLYNSKTLPDNSTLMALSLVRQGGPAGTPSPNLGELTTVGAFGRDGVTLSGFDVGPSGKAFVAVRLVAESGGAPFFALVKVLVTPDPADPVNLPAGKDEALGYIGDARIPVDDIAVLQSVQFDRPLIGATEPASGTSTLAITVSRHGGTSGTAFVTYSTRSDSAIAGSDFLTATGSLVFNPGEDIKTFNITLLSDGTPGVPEEDEVFHIVLSNPGVATLGGSNVATVRISGSDVADTRGPVITHFGLTGPSRGITGAVVEFNEDLDAATAENLANYKLFGTDRRNKIVPVDLTAAIYNPDTRAVQLIATPFVQTNLKRVTFSARGKAAPGAPGLTGIRDVANNLLDGNANGFGGDNATLKFAVLSGATFTIRDADGDRAVIEITGGGTIDANVLLGKRSRTQFWILDPIPLRSTVTGTVKPSRLGDGIVVISEIIGLDKKEFAPLLTSPSFRVNTQTFSSNATGVSGR